MTYLASRRAVPLRILLALFWLVAFGMGGMAQAKVGSVAKEDQQFFLPASAESTLAAEKVKEFSDESAIPALIIAVRDDGAAFTDADFALLQDLAAGFKDSQLADGTSLSDLMIGNTLAIPSADKTAALIPISMDTAKTGKLDANEDQYLISAVKGMRSFIEGALPEGSGISVYVSGPAGLAADLSLAFAGIDLLLLLVALVVVFIILVVVYRSLLMPLAVLGTAVTALCGAMLVVYNLAKADILVLNAQTQGILAILVIGATTDYCLLMIARYREELPFAATPLLAMAAALKGAWEPIVASGATVIAGLLTLMLSDLSSTASLGPIASIGIVFSMLAALTLLPGLLLLPGKRARVWFWPSKIALPGDLDRDDESVIASHGIWSKVAAFVGRNDRKVWLSTAVVLLAFAAFAPTFKASGVSTIDNFTQRTDSVVGFELLDEKFESGSVEPVTVVIAQDRAAEFVKALEYEDRIATISYQTPGANPAMAAMGGPMSGGDPAEATVVDGNVLLNISTTMEAEDKAAQDVVKELRTLVERFDADALVGGVAAKNLDVQTTARHDFMLIVPVVLVVIALMLMVLLRSVIAPLLLLGANVLSFATAMGLTALLFNKVLGHPGADSSVPLYSFVFLVALGIDYTIFLMSRVREESLHVGTRRGVLRGVAVTGGVITSAGIVLAATFSALVVVPLLFMMQLAIIVALGILIDTFVVRTFLVPGLVHDMGKVVWKPWTAKRVPDDEPRLAA